MSALRELLDSAIVYRLGWTLLHFLWEGVAVAVLLGLALAILRRRAAGVRYGVACAGMVVLATLPVVTFLLVSAPQRPAPMAKAPVARPIPLAPTKGNVAPRPVMVHLPPPPTPGSAGTARVETLALPAATVAAEEPVRSWRERASDAMRTALARVSPALPWLVVGWGVGAVMFSVWNLGGWVAVRRLRTRAISPADTRVAAAAARLAGRMGIWRAVRVLQSAVIDSPMVIGAIRPVILVPAGLLTGLSPTQLESILAHELAHVRRHDYIVNLLQGVVETLLFYHPAVWWVSRRVRVEREHCCDDEAVRVTGDRRAYVGALAAVAESAGSWGTSAVARLAPAARGGALLPRVRRVLGVPDADAGRSPRWMAGAVALAVCLVAGLTVVSRAQVPEQKPPAVKNDFADAPKMATLELEIVDAATSKPLADVELSVRETGGPRAWITDDAGKAKIDFRPDGKYLEIKAKRPGYVPTSLTWRSDRAKDPVPGEYLLKLEPATTIGGIIQDEAGKPVAGATVEVIIDRKGDSYNTRERAGVYNQKFLTDKDGKWVCDVAPREFGNPWIKLSHPDYLSDEMYGMTPKPPVAKLRDMTGTMVMKKGAPLAGRVIDKDGKPIRGADVAQGKDRFGSSYPSMKTGADGTFRFPQARAGGEIVLTVKAKGMAPELKSFVLPPEGAGDVEIKLEPGRTLKGRVVDEKGNPVPKAMVSVDTWRGNRSLMHRQDTDAEGRFVWNDAPADEVEIDFLKQGFMDARRTKLTASDQEVTVKLLPTLKVSGTVVDDSTGNPIPSFKVVEGIDWGQGQDVYWDTRSRSLTGQDGKFGFDISYPRPGHAVRVDAEGYLPGTSRLFKSDEKAVALEFRLKKGEALVATLKTPDGKPIAGADVVICSGQNGAYIRNGHIEQHSEATQVKSDGTGKFRVPPQTGRYTLAILHKDGYAEVTDEALAASRELTVRPWGRVEGTLKVGSKPKGNEVVNVTRQDANYRPNAPAIYHDIQTPTDAGGRFTFERVPAGRANVAVQVRLSENTTGYSQSTPIEVKAGETVTVAIGGTGRPIVGRIDVPEELKGKVNWAYANSSIMTKMDFPQPKRPDNFDALTPEQKQKWHEDWQKSPEGQAVMKQQQERKHYAVRIGGDGAYRVEDVVAGTYQLNVHVTDANSEHKFGGEMIGNATHEFSVPEMTGGRSDEALDVGKVEIKAMKRLKAGDAAPAFKAKTLDGKDLTLDEFKGKYVVVDFWATWCGPCVAEIPKFKEAVSAYAKDDRVVFLSLSLDEKAETAKKFVEKNEMTWRHGFLGEWGKTQVPGEWGVQGIPAVFLVGPDGKVIAKGLRGDTLKSSLQSAVK